MTEHTGITGTTHTLTDLQPDTTYRVQVRARNAAAASPYSAFTQFTTTAAAAPGPANGINISGAEFSPGNEQALGPKATFSNTRLQTKGTDYDYEPAASIAYLGGRGFRRVKVVTRMERLVSAPNAALNTTQVGYLRTELDAIAAAGMKAVVDFHNYGIYYLEGGSGGVRKVFGVSPELDGALADAWSRMATEFGDHAAITGGGGFAIMNEPQDVGGMTGPIWRAQSLEAVSAIWDVDPAIDVYVSGWSWADTQDWTALNGPTPWITDTRGRVFYEPHHYWDTNHSGDSDQTYTTALNAALADGYTAGPNLDALHTRILTEQDDVLDWLTSNGWPDDPKLKVCWGEIGWSNTTAAETGRWGALGQVYYQRCHDLGIPIFHWSCGYMYSAGSDFLLAYYSTVDGNPIDAAYPQASVIEQFTTPLSPTATLTPSTTLAPSLTLVPTG